ncbi:MAG TPA: hypothetical protein DCM48_12700, partial [Thalassospira sp.]|nr:hypothetical protein [Thalassospira sp.]
QHAVASYRSSGNQGLIFKTSLAPKPVSNRAVAIISDRPISFDQGFAKQSVLLQSPASQDAKPPVICLTA